MSFIELFFFAPSFSFFFFLGGRGGGGCSVGSWGKERGGSVGSFG